MLTSPLYQLYPPNFKLKIGGLTQNERRGEERARDKRDKEQERKREISRYMKFCKKVEEKSQGSSVC